MFCSFYYSNPVSRDSRQYGTENKAQGLPEGSGRFVPSKMIQELRNKLIQFMEVHIYPLENEFNKLARSDLRWTVHPEEERLKELAKKEGLWNLWIPVCIASSAFKLFLHQLLLLLIFAVKMLLYI